jgi:hypothetical protein
VIAGYPVAIVALSGAITVEAHASGNAAAQQMVQHGTYQGRKFFSPMLGIVLKSAITETNVSEQGPDAAAPSLISRSTMSDAFTLTRTATAASRHP